MSVSLAPPQLRTSSRLRLGVAAAFRFRSGRSVEGSSEHRDAEREKRREPRRETTEAARLSLECMARTIEIAEAEHSEANLAEQHMPSSPAV